MAYLLSQKEPSCHLPSDKMCHSRSCTTQLCSTAAACWSGPLRVMTSQGRRAARQRQWWVKLRYKYLPSALLLLSGRITTARQTKERRQHTLGFFHKYVKLINVLTENLNSDTSISNKLTIYIGENLDGKCHNKCFSLIDKLSRRQKRHL